MPMSADEIYEERKKFFNEHAARWRDMWYRDHTTGQYDRHGKDFDRLFSLIDLHEGDCVLDVGCGTGILVEPILERIGEKGVLFELDFAPRMIQVNRSIHSDKNVQFIVADAERAPLKPASCDTVVCFSCFPHFHDKEKAVRSLGQILKVGGTFVISHFDSSEGINKHHASCRAVMHDRLPKKEEMVALLNNEGLKITFFVDQPGFYCILARK